MRIPRIFTPQALKVSEFVLLDIEASNHILKVLRMSEGGELVLFNSNDCEYRAVITGSEKKLAKVEVLEENCISRESPLQTELAIGISKGDRMEWVLQKATELGVTRIVPLFTERTEVKLSGERLEKKLRQWKKIIQASCEQCQRNVIPELTYAMSLSEYLESSSAELRLVLHHRSDKKLNDYPCPMSVALLIGPEGGLSEAEISQAHQQQFNNLTLGPRVMRTETAPIAALSLLQYRWGDFA